MEKGKKAVSDSVTPVSWVLVFPAAAAQKRGPCYSNGTPPRVQGGYAHYGEPLTRPSRLPGSTVLAGAGKTTGRAGASRSGICSPLAGLKLLKTPTGGIGVLFRLVWL